jgi:hypothetical protein
MQKVHAHLKMHVCCFVLASPSAAADSGAPVRGVHHQPLEHLNLLTVMAASASALCFFQDATGHTDVCALRPRCMRLLTQVCLRTTQHTSDTVNLLFCTCLLPCPPPPSAAADCCAPVCGVHHQSLEHLNLLTVIAVFKCLLLALSQR